MTELGPVELLSEVSNYYSKKIREHGPTPKGVDWNSSDSQRLRFQKLLQICDTRQSLQLLDYGCGYGELRNYLQEIRSALHYTGYDISFAMIEAAQKLHTAERTSFIQHADALTPADIVVASGIFNVRLNTPLQTWHALCLRELQRLHTLSRHGFAFNMLTSYSDPDRMRPDLYYADPGDIFDYCKRNFSKNVALLHDYDLFEFTILVRKSLNHDNSKQQSQPHEPGI